jgi:4-hydroxybenzoate polyprenyltransferase
MPGKRHIHPIALMSYLALWPACYTLGVYLLDRVKISDSRQDPADAIALPDRAIIFAEHAARIRVLLMLELAIAIVAGFLISPLLALIPLGALLGVHLYAGRGASPGRPRFKDLPGLKSFFISSAHIALLVAVLWGNDHNLIEHPRQIVILGIIGIWLIVSSDAIMCDIDDHDSDAMYGTRSLPVLLGNAMAWLLAEGMLLTGCGLLLIRTQRPIELLLVSIAIFASTLPSRMMHNRRDLIDARLLPIVLIALMMR